MPETATDGGRKRAPRPPSLRDQRAVTVKRVLEQFQQTGSLPGTLRERLIDEDYALRWSEGRPLPREAVERHIDQWAADLLSQHDMEVAHNG